MVTYPNFPLGGSWLAAYTINKKGEKFSPFLDETYPVTFKYLKDHSIDGSPPGSPVPGILQARTLEWVAIAFSSA